MRFFDDFSFSNIGASLAALMGTGVGVVAVKFTYMPSTKAGRILASLLPSGFLKAISCP